MDPGLFIQIIGDEFIIKATLDHILCHILEFLASFTAFLKVGAGNIGRIDHDLF